MKHVWLWAGMLAGFALLVLISLGAGFWGGNGSSMHWTHRMLSTVCHQMPDRSFFLNGEQMAVNTRCLGVFAGLLAGWVLIPFAGRFTIEKKWPLWFLLVAVMIQIIDVSGNLIQMWENTNRSRFFSGIIPGVAISLMLADRFIRKSRTKLQKNGNGRI